MLRISFGYKLGKLRDRTFARVPPTIVPRSGDPAAAAAQDRFLSVEAKAEIAAIVRHGGCGMSPFAFLLAASITLNALLGWAWIDARDARTVAEQQRDQARADATAASDAVEALDDLAKKRAAVAKPVQAAARAAAVAAQQRATHEIATRRPSPATTTPARRPVCSGGNRGG